MPEQVPEQQGKEAQQQQQAAHEGASKEASPRIGSLYAPPVAESPALLGGRNIAQLQRSVGNRQVGQMLQRKPPIQRLVIQRELIQRELSKASFIEDTTWTFLCGLLHGRRGNAEVRTAVENALEAYESTDQGADALRALKSALLDARRLASDKNDQVIAPLITQLSSEVTSALKLIGESATVINLDEYPRGKALAEGIDKSLSINAKLAALQQNFAGITWFQYEMSGGGLTEVLKGTGNRGDCRTLAMMYEWVAINALGVPADQLKVQTYGKDYLVEGGGQVTNNGTLIGNVDDGGGQHWRFTSHSWILTPIGEIDLLFLAQPLSRSGWLDISGKGVDGDKPWHMYGGKIKIYRQNMAGITHRYTTDLSAARTEPLD